MFEIWKDESGKSLGKLEEESRVREIVLDLMDEWALPVD